MPSPKLYDLNHSAIWAKLHQHQRATRHLHMRELFEADPARFDKFSLRLGPLLLDYAKHRVTERTTPQLVAPMAQLCCFGQR